MLSQKQFIAIAVTAATMILSVALLGGYAMSSATMPLAWEWPDNRKPDGRLLVEIKKIEKEGGGLLGTRRSPSMADYMPDATIVTGTVAAGDKSVVGREVRLRLPGAELPAVTTGQRVGLGLVGQATCICIQKAPDGATP